MQASLPMYALPALRAAHDRYWSLIRTGLQEAGISAPDVLNPDGIGTAFWSAPDLVFSQTCGMPYRTLLHGKVQIVGTPDYALPGCPPGYYMSCLIKRRDDPRQTVSDFAGATVALNEFGSQSGFAAVAGAMTHARITAGKVVVTGAHAASIKEVAAGRADLAAIDVVTWAHQCRHQNAGTRVEAFAQTTPTPGLPYICSLSVDRQKVSDAVSAAINSLSDADKDLLMLRGLVHLGPEIYTAVPTPDATVLTNN